MIEKNRALEYYQKYGLKNFIKHSVKKFLCLEQREYQKYRKDTLPSMEMLECQREKIFPYMPKISIVVPLYRTPEKYLCDMIDSVYSQTYQNWELCLSDGSGEDSDIWNIVEKYRGTDKRIKAINSKKQLCIAENTNRAVELCTGDFIAFMDHDDLLSEDALFRCVEYLNGGKVIELIYTDEDKVSDNGKNFFQPHFKSDFNKDLLLSMNYICHLVVVKKEILQKIGGFRKEFDGAQDYDFLLRCIEVTDKIVHIPYVLYHWRVHDNSTAKGVDRKNFATEAGRKALQDYCDRNNIQAKAENTIYSGIYRIRYLLKEKSKVSIIIPNKDHKEDLELCISSIQKKAGYDCYEIIVIENNSEDEETFLYYETLEKENDRVKIIYWEKEFNFSTINNWGTKYADGEYLLFLNNDVEWISEDFLKEMLSTAQRREVGVVGGLLYFPDDTVQHAGVIIGYSGIAGHAFIGQLRGEQGYFSRIVCMQDYSAVTAACLMVRKDVFIEVNGFDENFKVAFNDIDFCLKVRETGRLVVYNPYIYAYHYESKTRGSDEDSINKERFEKEKNILRKKWKKYIINGDPYYNINLTLKRPDFTIRNPHIKKGR